MHNHFSEYNYYSKFVDPYVKIICLLQNQIGDTLTTLFDRYNFYKNNFRNNIFWIVFPNEVKYRREIFFSILSISKIAGFLN